VFYHDLLLYYSLLLFSPGLVKKDEHAIVFVVNSQKPLNVVEVIADESVHYCAKKYDYVYDY
jgi:hypothetical protein